MRYVLPTVVKLVLVLVWALVFWGATRGFTLVMGQDSCVTLSEVLFPAIFYVWAAVWLSGQDLG